MRIPKITSVPRLSFGVVQDDAFKLALEQAGNNPDEIRKVRNISDKLAGNLEYDVVAIPEKYRTPSGVEIKFIPQEDGSVIEQKGEEVADRFAVVDCGKSYSPQNSYSTFHTLEAAAADVFKRAHGGVKINPRLE